MPEAASSGGSTTRNGDGGVAERQDTWLDFLGRVMVRHVLLDWCFLVGRLLYLLLF